VDLVNGFTPAAGQTFDVLRAPSISVSNLMLTGDSAGLSFSIVSVGGGQVLRLSTAAPFSQIIDDGDAGFSTTGIWTVLTGQGFQNDLHTGTGGGGFATYQFTGLAAGTYRVAATWTAGADRAPNATIQFFSDLPIRQVTFSQVQAPDDFTAAGTMWENLGTLTVSNGTLTVIISNASTGLVIADAIRIERVS
jgi:hypothetical protein